MNILNLVTNKFLSLDKKFKDNYNIQTGRIEESIFEDIFNDYDILYHLCLCKDMAHNDSDEKYCLIDNYLTGKSKKLPENYKVEVVFSFVNLFSHCFCENIIKLTIDGEFDYFYKILTVNLLDVGEM